MPNNVIFKKGTSEQFQVIEQKDVSTLYWLEDTQELYNGDKLYGTGKEATAQKAGLMSAADKAKLDSMTGEGGIANLAPVDASVVIAAGEDTTAIGVQLSEEEGNAIELKTDGLFVGAPEAVNVPEYAIEKMAQSSEGAVASYRLKRTLNGDVTYPGDVIDIPKDMVIQSGSLKVVEEANVPYEGAEIGDPYIDLVLNNATSSHIYIPMKGIIDTSDFASKADVSALQAVVASMPDQIISELVNVNRTETTNTAELRIFTKTEDGTYSPAVQHGVLTLIPAGQGPDGKQGAGLMSLADKQKLDAIDLDEIEALSTALTWGTI